MEKGHVINKTIINAQQKKRDFLKGIQMLFSQWSAFRLCLDNLSYKVYNNSVNVIDEDGKEIEELEFNIILGTLYEEICTILVMLQYNLDR